jgi:Raf kinase inhibitor-like YbhB/YbcL family protein
MDLRLTSPAFADGAPIPRRFTADGDDVSPPLTWNETPDGTRSLAVVVEDPDAPRGTFTHWLAWDIDPRAHALREGDAGDAKEGANGFGEEGWRGPSPPKGKPHHYVFRLLALDEPLGLPDGATREEVDRAIDGHVLAETRLVGIYGR